MSAFWQNWLGVWCASAATVGIILAGAGFESTSGPAHLYFQIAGRAEGFSPTPEMRLALTVLGGVMVGWGLTLWTAIQAALKLGHREARPVWHMLTVAMVAWFIIDSTFSVHTGFWRNAAVNALFFAGFLLPVVKTGVLQEHPKTVQSQNRILS